MVRYLFVCVGSLFILLFVSFSWARHGDALEAFGSSKHEGGHGRLGVEALKISPEALYSGKQGDISGIVRKNQSISQAKGGKKDIWGEKKKGEIPWKEEETEKQSRFELSGRFWNRYGHDIDDDNSFEDTDSNHSEFQLKAEYTPDESMSILLSVDVDYFLYRGEEDWDHDYDIRPYECYMRFSGSNFELTIGNQFVRWGKTDEVSPFDIMNPEDLRDGFVRSREERKIPIPMLDINLFEGMHKVEVLFIPFFKKSELDLVGRNWAFLNHYDQKVGDFTILEEDPPDDLPYTEAGIRLAGTFRGLDYAFSYLYTRDDFPSIDSLSLPPNFFIDDPDSVALEDLVTLAIMSNQPIYLRYVRQNVVGFEFETTWWNFGLRGDVAYVYKKLFITNKARAIERPVYTYVLGADYNGPGSFYFNLQFSQEIIQHYDDSILFFSEVTNTVNGKISKGFLDNNMEIGLRYLYNFTNEDYYINPSVIVKYWKNISLDFGLEIVGGPPCSTLGTYDHTDNVYGIFQYQF